MFGKKLGEAMVATEEFTVKQSECVLGGSAATPAGGNQMSFDRTPNPLLRLDRSQYGTDWIRESVVQKILELSVSEDRINLWRQLQFGGPGLPSGR